LYEAANLPTGLTLGKRLKAGTTLACAWNRTPATSEESVGKAAVEGPGDEGQMKLVEAKMGAGNLPAPDEDQDSERNALSHCLYPSLQKFEDEEPLPLNHQCQID
jgi:hypothetical protein